MEIFRILDELELMLKEGKKMLLSSGKVIVEPHRFLDRLDRIRAILPEELESARSILYEKERIVEEACIEADQYVEQSKNRVARMVDDNEITRHAMGMAEDIIAKAEQVAMDIRRDANEYADGVLAHMEMVLQRGVDTINEGRESVRQALKDRDY